MWYTVTLEILTLTCVDNLEREEGDVLVSIYHPTYMVILCLMFQFGTALVFIGQITCVLRISVRPFRSKFCGQSESALVAFLWPLIRPLCFRARAGGAVDRRLLAHHSYGQSTVTRQCWSVHQTNQKLTNLLSHIRIGYCDEKVQGHHGLVRKFTLFLDGRILLFSSHYMTVRP